MAGMRLGLDWCFPGFVGGHRDSCLVKKMSQRPYQTWRRLAVAATRRFYAREDGVGRRRLNEARTFSALMMPRGVLRRRFPLVALDGHVDRQLDRGAHAPRIRAVSADDVEGGAVVRTRADDRQTDRHVDGLVEREQLHRDQALV